MSLLDPLLIKEEDIKTEQIDLELVLVKEEPREEIFEEASDICVSTLQQYSPKIEQNDFADTEENFPKVEDSGVQFLPKPTKNRAYCSVYGCSKRAETHPTLRFHKFPRFGQHFLNITNNFGKLERIDRAKLWMIKLKMPKHCITKSTIVCSLHFKRDDYILPNLSAKRRSLKSIAVPSCNLPTIEKINNVKSNCKTRKRWGEQITMYIRSYVSKTHLGHTQWKGIRHNDKPSQF